MKVNFSILKLNEFLILFYCSVSIVNAFTKCTFKAFFIPILRGMKYIYIYKTVNNMSGYFKAH